MDTGTQVAELLESLQSPATLYGQCRQRRCQQIAESLAVAASHTASHLVQVGESEVVSSIDDDGVGIGNIDTVLHDSCRQQHVVVIILEVDDNLFQFLRFHLPVTHGDTGIRDIFADEFLDALQVVDARIDEIHLSVARHLEIDGVGNHLCTKGMYLGLNGIAVRGRCLYDAQVAGSHQRELQGPGNGRSTHGQCVDVGLHLTQLFLRRDTELLFLVDDE